MTAEELRAVRKRVRMTQAQLEEALDLTPGTIANYEGTRGSIPRVIGLACETLLIRHLADVTRTSRLR